METFQVSGGELSTMSAQKQHVTTDTGVQMPLDEWVELVLDRALTRNNTMLNTRFAEIEKSVASLRLNFVKLIALLVGSGSLGAAALRGIQTLM